MPTPLDTSVLSPEFINKSLGEYVKKLRKNGNLTQASLGTLLGIDQSAMCRVEKGLQQLSAVQWFTLCSYFGIPSGHLRVAVNQSLRQLERVKKKKLKKSGHCPRPQLIRRQRRQFDHVVVNLP
jgi:transcriptional regulator with XRE-family HTH domain